VQTEAIHGDKSQSQRDRIMSRFRKGTTRILIATDLASRGLHVHDITYIINYAFPLDINNYVHRIGRTGRAGTSLSFSLTFTDTHTHTKHTKHTLNTHTH
jgi:superfamily II DNA/RNA helicase